MLNLGNLVHEVNINCRKANHWFVEQYSSEIKDFHYCKRYFNQGKTAELDDIYYFLYDDLELYALCSFALPLCVSLRLDFL